MPSKHPKMSLQLVKLDPPRGGICYICGDIDGVITTGDTAVDRNICSECADGALAVEKFICLAFPTWGMRHPRPYETHMMDVQRINFL